MGVNKVILVGNVGRDPEMRALPSGTNLAKFSLATTERGFKDPNGEPRTEWHNIVVWGKLAEFCSQYVTKGRQLYVEGRIHTHSYEKNGQKVYFTEINAHTVELLGSRQDSGGGGGSSGGGESYGGGPSGYPDDQDDVPF